MHPFLPGIHDVVAFINREHHFIPHHRHVLPIPNIHRFSQRVVRTCERSNRIEPGLESRHHSFDFRMVVFHALDFIRVRRIRVGVRMIRHYDNQDGKKKKRSRVCILSLFD